MQEIPVGFGSNTKRSEVTLKLMTKNIGPGAYALPSGLRKELPNYVGFSSASSANDCFFTDYDIKIYINHFCRA